MRGPPGPGPRRERAGRGRPPRPDRTRAGRRGTGRSLPLPYQLFAAVGTAPEVPRPAGGSALVFELELVAVLGVAVQGHRHLGHALEVLLEELVGVEDGGADLRALLDFGGQAPVQLGMEHEGRLLAVGDGVLGHHQLAVLIEVDADAALHVDVVGHVDGAGVSGVAVVGDGNAGLVLQHGVAAADGGLHHRGLAGALIPGGGNHGLNGVEHVAGGAAAHVFDDLPRDAVLEGVEGRDLVAHKHEDLGHILVHGFVHVVDFDCIRHE